MSAPWAFISLQFGFQKKVGRLSLGKAALDTDQSPSACVRQSWDKSHDEQVLFAGHNVMFSLQRLNFRKQGKESE